MVDGRGPVISGTRMAGTNKSLGQHWLRNRAILEEIADLSLLGIRGSAYDFDKGIPVCVEIGPGLGTLTSSLLKRFNKVIAVEFDERLAKNLLKSFPGTNLEVINADILKFDFTEVDSPYVIAGNIPYYITSPIIEKVLSTLNVPERVVLLIQKEVAERILSDKETILSLMVKNRAAVFAGPVVPAREFTPPPKVDSQVIVMEPYRDGPRVSEAIFDLIRRGFSSPRKKLIHNLAGLRSKEEILQILMKSGVSMDARPGDLNLEDWDNLYKNIKRV